MAEIKNFDKIEWKRIKFKLNDDKGKELVSVYFNPEFVLGEGPIVKFLEIPPIYEKNLKTQKLHYALKRTKMMRFEDDVDTKEVMLAELNQTNEFKKTVRYQDDKTKKIATFELTIRVRQNFKKDEKDVKTLETQNVKTIYESFKEYQAKQPAQKPQ